MGTQGACPRAGCPRRCAAAWRAGRRAGAAHPPPRWRPALRGAGDRCHADRPRLRRPGGAGERAGRPARSRPRRSRRRTRRRAPVVRRTGCGWCAPTGDATCAAPSRAVTWRRRSPSAGRPAPGRPRTSAGTASPATLLALPAGVALGRVDADSAVAACAVIESGELPLGVLRGAAGIAPRAQVAELDLRAPARPPRRGCGRGSRCRR